jgi:MoaA/NifB/PqqE/SkfB family radical SAM enzyme
MDQIVDQPVARVPVGDARLTPRGQSFFARSVDTLRLVRDRGGPAFTQFALNNACNANCGFCGFARETFPKEKWKYADRQGGLDAIDILYRQGTRFLLFTGGEPTLHPDILEFTAHAARLGMKVMLVSNAGLFKPHKLRELHKAGITSFIISVDAHTVEAHEANRGLPGVCEKIIEANKICKELKVECTASVTMSRLVDYDKLPAFLEYLGFSSVTFSYPLTSLDSNFLSFSTSDLVSYTKDELLAAFDKVKALKSKFQVVNPSASIDEMKRFVTGGRQKFPCLGGYTYFYLDWDLMLWRCHNWAEPMCHIRDFDDTKLVRDGCTKCMIDCYRDSSVMQHIAVSAHDSWQALKKGRVGEGLAALTRTGNMGSIGSVLEELPWILRF